MQQYAEELGVCSCYTSTSVATIWASLYIRLPALEICAVKEATDAENGIGFGKKWNSVLFRLEAAQRITHISFHTIILSTYPMDIRL